MPALTQAGITPLLLAPAPCHCPPSVLATFFLRALGKLNCGRKTFPRDGDISLGSPLPFPSPFFIPLPVAACPETFNFAIV